MNRRQLIRVAASVLLFSLFSLPALADSCLKVTLTGTMGGPASLNGLAGAGTLISYGDRDNQCNDLQLQFDAGRGTSLRLSQLDIGVNELDALFLTHLHSDHVAGVADILTTRWHFGAPQLLDVVCSADVAIAAVESSHVMSCSGLIASVSDSAARSGELAQRRSENPSRSIQGPSAAARLDSVELPLPLSPRKVWSRGEVTVSAIASSHIAGHLSYRVDTPAGSVVVAGDAGNHISRPPRASSTSEQVELLSAGADVLVHSVIHPVMSPQQDSGFPAVAYFRQSTSHDIGAMAQRAGVSHVLLTHMIPVIGAVSHGPYIVPGGPLTPDDYAKSVRESGFQGAVDVGRDLLTLTIPNN